MNQQRPINTVLISGGTGMIGKALSGLLIEKGYNVIILSRSDAIAPLATNPDSSGSTTSSEKSPAQGCRTAHWDPARQIIDPEAIRQADCIIHLAGAGVADKRWSAKRKKEIVESRTESGNLIVRALHEIPNKVQTVISVSGIGWYGADPSIPNPHPFVETDPADAGFLGETCRLWEAAMAPVKAMGKRLVIFRTSIVLSRNGGALEEFRRPVKAGLAAILGSGKQIISWIHIDDLTRLFVQALEQKDWQGVYNAVAPRPVNNRFFTKELARRLKGRFFVPVYVPSFLLKIILGELSVEVLKSATVSSEKVSQSGFQFIYPSVEIAFTDLLSG